MGTLFRIETGRVVLSWNQAGSGGGGNGTAPGGLNGTLAGELRLRKLSADVEFGPGTRRAGVPDAVAADPAMVAGPQLFEETDYHLMIHATNGRRVDLHHVDPVVRKTIHSEQDGRLLHGTVNFRSQIGRSDFAVWVDGRPEFEFSVKVFPSKIDFESDYAELLAEVQEIVTGLALEYLQSTWQEGQVAGQRPANVEWLTLLTNVMERLERALHHIAAHPVRGLSREPHLVRAGRLKRIDSGVRSAVRKGAGKGLLTPLGGGIHVRERMEELRPRPTLDTPEHRWIGHQLREIRRRLEQLRREERERQQGARAGRGGKGKAKGSEKVEGAPGGLAEETRQSVIEGRLQKFGERVTALLRLEPLAEARPEPPPAGFASLQLMGAPGYREAYRCCLILSMGLRVENGPMRLAVKDLHLLYEYWCYLTLVREVGKTTGKRISPEQLVSVTQSGVRVLLEKGKKRPVSFDLEGGRRVTVTYSPEFSKPELVLIPQRPDMMLSFQDPAWPRVDFILDAKYRVNASAEYRERYGTAGPPEDALNIMHRYRDAILECLEEEGETGGSLRRTIIQAAAVFPHREEEDGEFGKGRLWRALEKIGVGAFPLLPGSTEYLGQWLRSTLQRGGWSLADTAIAHGAQVKAAEWVRAAAETVLVGVLRGAPDTEAHWEWIRSRNRYFMPWQPPKGGSGSAHQRQFVVRYVAFYLPKELRGRGKEREGECEGECGAVEFFAPVESMEVISQAEREELDTPWTSAGRTEQYVLYKLGPVRPTRVPIRNRTPEGKANSFAEHRWTSKLALDRAEVVAELFLGSEAEWRLYEALTAAGLPFRVRHGGVLASRSTDEVRRARFVLEERGVQIDYRGSGGFALSRDMGAPVRVGSVEGVMEALGR